MSTVLEASTGTGTPTRQRSGPSAARGWIALTALVCLAGAVLALTAGSSPGGRLDPSSSERSGALALAALLQRQGVTVTRETVATTVLAAAARPDTTVLVVGTNLLAPERARTLASSGAELVLVEPPSDVLAATVPEVTSSGRSSHERAEPECALDAATRAGRVGVEESALYVPASHVDAAGFRTAPAAAAPAAPATSRGVTACYAQVDGASLITAGPTANGSRRAPVTVLGNGTSFTNLHLGEEGNAALGLALLGRHSHLIWYIPSLADVPSTAKRPLSSFVPDAVRFGAIQLLVALLLVALWKARRLGPVVAEPLPIVVRAIETVEGRARLYRRAKACDVAGEVLRAATRTRLVQLLGLPRATTAATLIDTLAQRHGWRASDIGDLLYGAPAADDDALSQLAHRLDALERKVRTP